MSQDVSEVEVRIKGLGDAIAKAIHLFALDNSHRDMLDTVINVEITAAFDICTHIRNCRTLTIKI